MAETGADDHRAFPVLVLAAGSSRRMGRAKALLRLNGGTLLDHAIGQAKQLGTPVTVVTGCRSPLVRYRCRVQPSAWVYARGWRAGMSESLKAGLASLGPSARGAFIVLLDQPLVGPGSLGELAEAARSNPSRPVAADMQGKPGAPAYIPKQLWPHIMMLEGDRGAAAILARNGARRIAMAGAESDVDTPADWRRISHQLADKSWQSG